MKINSLFTLLVILVALAFLFFSDQAEPLDIKRMVQGIVKAIRVDSIEILSDPNGKEVQITIDPNTVYDNVQKSADLIIGDRVQVEYQTIHHQNKAITITKFEMEN